MEDWLYLLFLHIFANLILWGTREERGKKSLDNWLVRSLLAGICFFFYLNKMKKEREEKVKYEVFFTGPAPIKKMGSQEPISFLFK
jgi:hypothetical protein